MNGRLVAVTGLMLAMTAFAGCIEAVSFLSTSDGEITAAENRDLADNAAAAWNPDAQLMAVFTFENANATDMFPSDPTVGNGKSVLWFYGYTAKNGTEARAFQVSADGEVIAMNESLGEVPSDVGEPLGAWEIDSDRAVEIARGNETFGAVAAGPESSMMEALGAQDGLTVWAIMAGSETGQAMAVLNAVTGDIIMVQSFSLDFEIPAIPGFEGPATYTGPQVEIEDAQTLDSSTWSYEYPFTLARADLATIEISFSQMLPTDGLMYMVTNEAGDIVYEESASGFFLSPQGGNHASEFTLDETGDYVLTLVYDTRTPLPIGSVSYDLYFLVGMPCEEAASSGSSGGEASMSACMPDMPSGGG